MKTSKAHTSLPIPVKRALQKLGADISVARRRRCIPTTLMAERAFVDRRSVVRVEKGDPSVSLGIYATILFVLGMEKRLADLVSPANDPLGQMLADEKLPKRAFRSRTNVSAGYGS
jgi:hypothetical protein